MSHPSDLPIDKLIRTERFITFIKSVRSFCDFIENGKNKNNVAFLRLAQSHLQNIYAGGQQLQFVDLDHNIDFEDIMTAPEFETILARLSDELNNRYYWHVFDPVQEKDLEPVCGDLHDDLGDIYKDLKNSILLFDTGAPAAIESAVWTFKWSFDNHWGDHCMNATYALHFFIQAEDDQV